MIRRHDLRKPGDNVMICFLKPNRDLACPHARDPINDLAALTAWTRPGLKPAH